MRSWRDVMRLVVGETAALIGLGLLAGFLAALALTPVLGSLLYGVGARDALTFVGAPIVMSAVAILAAVVPAIRASRIDPMVSMRID